MLFSSQIFILIFLPLTLALYYLLNNQKLRIRGLIVLSFVFYAYWDYRFLPLLISSIILNYIFGLLFVAYKKNWIIYIGILLNLLNIGIFKYFDFFSGILSSLFASNISPSGIILPLGISFFTFQQISYLIDLKRGEAKRYKFDEFVLFISFFPQLIAGPIIRHSEIISQFSNSPYRHNIHEYIYRGLILFILGLAKKVLIADELSIVNDGALESIVAGDNSSSSAWLFALGYTLQLYFDFSAYSDMAIGLGAMFGFKLPKNFLIPYCALNLQDFWRRWHLTLSRFFKDYIYISLGGSRNGYKNYIFAVLVTMTLCGLWHGAGWSFVLWGFFHGCGLIIFNLWKRIGIKLPFFLAWLITFIFVLCGWVLFRTEDILISSNIISIMFTFNSLPMFHMHEDKIVFIILCFLLSIFGLTNYDFAFHKAKPNALTLYPVSLLLFVCIVMIGDERTVEFIYFQF